MLNPSRRFFLVLVSIYLIVLQTSILILPKGEEIIYFYAIRNDILTHLFIFITHIGEWIPLTCIGIYLLFKNRKALAAIAVAFIPSDLLVLWVKKLLAYPRPLIYFNHGEILPIDNFSPLFYNSMPSGHTFSAFFSATVLCTLFNLNKLNQCLVFGIAILVGVSRMYLMCHFKEDVFVGSAMGILAGILPIFIYKYFPSDEL